MNFEKNYQLLEKQLISLFTKDEDYVTNLSNVSALLNQFLENINWVGFYLVRNNELHLGPFQGLPACVRIPFTRGVCGACATTLQTQRVDDVHQFPGHIACDSASNSEVVIPIIINNQLYGLLDIDSPLYNRFTTEETIHLEHFVKTLETLLSEIL
jgi:GAF domain-containing protein